MHLRWPTIPPFATRRIRYGSVCSGIEAATVAWQPLGWEPAWFSQFDPEHDYTKSLDFPSAVLAHHYPQVPNLGDIAAPDWIARAAALGDIDVLVGGTPCQAFSIAGMRAGLEDPRGLLTLRFVELANAADPAIVLWENVPGVLSDKTNGFGCLLAGLAGEDVPLESPGKRWPDAGCVFGPQRAVAWRVINAQYCGVAQRRRRVFVVACPHAVACDPCSILFEFESLRRDTPPSREAGESPAGTVAGGARRNGGYSTDDIPLTVGVDLRNGAVTGEVAHTVQAGRHAPDPGGTPHVLEPLAFPANLSATQRATTSNLSPALGAKNPTAVAVFGGNNTKGPIDVAPALNANQGCHNPGDFTAGTLVLAFGSKRDGSDMAVELSPTLRAGGHTTSHANAGLPPAIVAVKTHRATSPDDAEIWREDLGVAPTLTAKARDYDDGQTQVVAFAGSRVRRLMPIECERLQGFPDYYTAIPYRGKAEGCCPDGPRYKALGNSMAVPVIRWLGVRMHLALTNPAALEPPIAAGARASA